STAERSATRLADSAQQVAKQVEAIDNQTKSTLASVRLISGSFADEAGTLQLHTQQAEQQLRNMLTVASGLKDQAKNMRESISEEATRVISSVGEVTVKMESAANQLKQNGQEAIANADESTKQFNAIIQSSCDMLRQQADSLGATAATVETNMLGAGDKIRSNLRLVNDASEQADFHAKQLAATAENATTRLDALRGSLNSSDAEGRAILAQASERIEIVKSKLYDELQQIAEVSDAAVRLIQTASGSLMNESDTLRSNLSSSESALVEAAALVREEGTQLPSLIERGAAQIEAANQALKEHATSASDTLVKTADRFIGVTGSIRDSMMEEMRDLDSVTSTAEQTLRSFTQALSDQLQAVQTGTGALASEQKTLVVATGQTIDQLSAAAERLHVLHQDAASTADQLSRAFSNVEQRADSADKKLSHISVNIGQQIEQLAQTASKAEDQMVGASQGFREQLERIRSGVQSQIDDINRGLMQITAQLERTSTTLRSSTTSTINDIEKIGSRFEQTSKDASNQLTERTARMRVSTEEVAKLLNGFGDQLDILLDRLSMAGDGIKRHESDLLGQLQTALSQLGSVAERLEANRLLTSSVSEQAVSRLSEVSQIVEKQMQDFSADSDTVSGIMRGVGKMYTDQSQTLNRGVSDAQNQVLAMGQTMDELQQRADRMRIALKLQGDELVGSLEQILQQLATAGDLVTDTVDDLSVRRIGSGNNVA
ncbi:MAG: hypothetical protein PHX43_02090, partial [Alphaproteobacteria bacterium]|nr:hypothetical protein [Alphaproteobacteria bacterium]